MYQLNKNLRSCEEKIAYTIEMTNEVIKCQNDIIYFAENYFYIVTLDKGKILIPLWDFQKKILRVFVDPPNGKQHIILLASRQVSKTTLAVLYALHFAIFNKDKSIAILANKEKIALDIMKRVKFAYESLPIFMQWGIVEWNKSSIVLENGSKIFAFSTASTAIRGMSVNACVLDEFAFVPDSIAEDFMRSVYPTLSSGKTTKMIITSTTNGMNHFFNIWKNATEGIDDKGDENDKGNSYYPIKIPWNAVPGRDENFKKKTIKNVGLVTWNQEYACKFLGSSNTLIEADVLETIKVKEPLTMKWQGALAIYEEPKPGAFYVLGCDAGKGLGKDYAVCQVLRINSEFDIEQVATYRNNLIDPKKFGHVIVGISNFYNNALIMLETNDVAGTICSEEIWYELECERLLNCDKKGMGNGLGISATKATKPRACMLLKRYMEEGFLKICDRETLLELSKFIEIRLNVFESQNKGHDDTVTSLYWALYFIETEYYDGKDNSIKQLEDQYKLSYEEPISFFTDGTEFL